MQRGDGTRTESTVSTRERRKMLRLPVLAIVLGMAACNSAFQSNKEGTKLVVSTGIKPDQVSLGEKHSDGPPKSVQTMVATEKTPFSKEEARAQVSMYIISAGVGLILIGVGLMVARHYTAGIAVPSWVPRLVVAMGAGVVIWGSVPATYRAWIVGFVIVGGLIWMYYGSKNNNKELVEGTKHVKTS